MNKSYSYLIKNGNFNIEKFLPQINAISFIGLLYLIFRFIFVAFFQNSYEVLHIDERIIINDIYNVWNLDNEFNRYPNVENDLIKNIYLVITEFAYGGDLRYGRIWSNIFIIFLGPFSLFGDQTLITAVRIFTITIYFISINLLINLYLNKNLRWFYCLIFYTIPGVLYFNSVPKPDPFVIFFISIALYYLNEKKYNKSIMFFGIATGVKIVGIFALLLAIIYLLYTKKITSNFKSIGRALFYSWLGFVIANPVLILPPISIGNLPNFYSVYYKWIDSQSLYDQERRFSFDYFQNWLETLSIHFSYGFIRSEVFSILMILFFLYFIFKLISYEKINIGFISLIGLTHCIFIIISVQRQWILYLNYSFIFIFLGLLYFLNLKKYRYIYSILFFLIIVPNGLIKTNSSLAARDTSISKEISSINMVVDRLEDLYENKETKFNVVYWDPSIGMPRNNVTFQGQFDVRENWEGHDLDYILEFSDFYVTKNDLNSDKYNKFAEKDYFIYTKKN